MILSCINRLRSALVLLAAAFLLSGGLLGCSFLGVGGFSPSVDYDVSTVVEQSCEKVAGLPAYSGDPSVQVDGNVPSFTDAEITDVAFEDYWPLDRKGRVVGAFGCVGPETMPQKERGDISEVYPTGWRQAEYSWIDGGVLYNRCHLISHSLGAEDANERNLMTGTRYMNTEGMLPYELLITNYIRETGNHVMYRVVPVFSGSNLVADGVHMQALSVEDGGRGISFNVYCYNVQPGVSIDYATGKSVADGESGSAFASSATGEQGFELGSSEYVLNTNSKRIHRSDCEAVESMSDSNKKAWDGPIDELIEQGYVSCGICNP